MDEDDQNPSQMNCRLVKNALITNVVYLNKKRKFREEQLGLPLPKHKCFERVLRSGRDSLLNQSQKDEDFQTCMIYEDTVRETSDDGSGHESEKDSNSFVMDSDSAMSAYYGEAKSEPDFAKISTCDWPSTSSGTWGSSSFQNTVNSLDSKIVSNMGAGKEELTYRVVGQHPHHQKGKFQEYHNPEEHILEYEDVADYSCLEYGNDGIEQFKDKDLEDMPCSGGMNPNVFVLSSGRWSVTREAQQGTQKKPTIDQEFEQYFSSLMLQ